MYDSFYLSYFPPPLYDDGFFKVTGITHSVKELIGLQN